MILPRPLFDGLEMDDIVDFIKIHFSPGDEFELCLNKRPVIYKFIGVFDLVGPLDFNRCTIVKAYIGQSKIRVERIGILRFYCQVTKDIGLLKPLEPESLSAIQWLTSGIDGVTNGDRLAKMWAINGKILPDISTENGKALRQLIKESNKWIKRVSNTTDVQSILEMIDTYLFKYNTYLEELISKEGSTLTNKSELK